MFKKTISAKVLVLLALGLFTTTLSAQNCDAHQKLIDLMDKSFEEHNVDLLDKVYHQDAVFHGTNGDTKGLTALKESQTKFFKEVPDAHGINDMIVCTDDHIIVRWTGTGTPVNAPKSIKITGITIYEVKDGKVTEAWEEMNELALLMQMGYQVTPPASMEKESDK